MENVLFKTIKSFEFLERGGVNRFVDKCCLHDHQLFEMLQEWGSGARKNEGQVRKEEEESLRSSEQVDWEGIRRSRGEDDWEGRQDWLPVARPQ